MENGFFKIKKGLIRRRNNYPLDSIGRIYYNRQIEDVFEVKISPIHEVLSKKEITAIRNIYILCKNNYEVAYFSARQLSQIMDAEIKYVEGLVTDIMLDSYINCAFVKVNDKYINPYDIFGDDLDIGKAYAVLGEYSLQYASEKMFEWGYTGDVYLNTRLLIDAKITK